MFKQVRDPRALSTLFSKSYRGVAFALSIILTKLSQSRPKFQTSDDVCLYLTLDRIIYQQPCDPT
jgi:hypothetical protein